MAIIQSCCCWRSLRKGCYTSAAYTLLFFTISIITMAYFIEEEQRYLSGETMYPTSQSFLEVDTISPTTVIFNIALLICSILGILFSILLIVGVYKDFKYFLLPWIVIMITETLVEVVHNMYLLYLETLNFNPITATVFTLDFFILMINIYSIVCVISQYQEYQAGRGTASFDYEERMASVQYTAAVQTTTTVSSGGTKSRRTSGVALPLISKVIENEESVAIDTTPRIISINTNKPKKHVQFPDDKTLVEDSVSDIDAMDQKSEQRIVSSLWMEREAVSPTPER